MSLHVRALSLLLVFLCAAALVVSGPAEANPGPWAQLFDVMQKGQDVSVQIAVIKPMHLSLVKERDGDSTALFENRLVGEDDPAELLCLAIDEPGCDEPDAGCRDCDDDGDAECLDDCFEMHLYEYLDECVTPGEATYELHPEEILDDGHVHAMSVDVKDSGDACLDADSETHDDLGTDADADSSDSCSVTSVGRAAVPHFLALVMLAIGLVAARVGGER